MFDLITLRATRLQRATRTVLALLLPLLAGMLQWAFSNQLTAARWPLFFPVLLLAPLLGGLWGGVGATLLSTLLIWYFFLPPGGSWLLTTTGNAIALLLFAATGLAFTAFVQRLRDSEERYRAVFEYAGDGIIVFDAQGCVVAANPAAGTLLGRPDGALLGADLRDLIHDFSPADWFGAEAPSAQPRSIQVERTLWGADRRGVTIEWIGTRLHNQQHLAVIRDISARKRVETDLRASEDRLTQQVAARTDELEATVAELRRANEGKDAFLASVSHELRTPLTIIFGMAEVLEAETSGPLNATQQNYVAAILAGGQRLLASVESILLFTNLLAGKRPIRWEPCRVGELCSTAVRMVAPLAAAKQQLLTRVYEPPDLVVVSDAEAIVTIVRLLLDNAIKFTPPGGSIDLHVTGGPGACIAVADTGIGMDEDQVAALFRPFQQNDQRLERSYEGLGLSLAYVYELVTRLGGTVTVTSAPRAGSRFEVRLP